MFPRAKQLRSVFLIGFLLTLALALTGYLDSSFVATLVDVRKIGLLFSLGSCAAIAGLALLPRLLSRIKLSGVFHVTVLLYLGAILGMVNTAHPLLFQALFIIYLVSGIGIYFAIDLLLEHAARHRGEGKVRGIYLSIYNLAYLLGPLIAGMLLRNNSFELVYLLAGFIVIIMFAIYLSRLDTIQFENHHHGLSFLKNIGRLLRNRDLRNVSIGSFSLSFFFSLMSIYTPIYLNQFVGFDWGEIGAIFSMMHVPYIALEPLLGRMADQMRCERQMISIGFIIIGIFTGILGFVTSSNVYVWAMALALTRVGAALVQVGTESYFFKKIKPDDADLIALYRNSSPLAYIAGPLVATLILALASYQHLFIILGVIMICVTVFTTRIKNVTPC